MTRLQADLLGAYPRLMAGRLEPASGWLHSDLAGRAALGQATAAFEKEKESAANTTADREMALKEAKAARDCCQVLEDELQGVGDQLVKEVRLRQEQEDDVKAREAVVEGREAKLKKRRDRLGTLEQELGPR